MHWRIHYGSYCSVAKLCPILCDRMDCSPPAFPVLHFLLEFAQTHVHWVSDAISSSAAASSSCPQSCPTSWSFPLSRLFASGGQSIGASASVLPMNIHGWFPLGLTSLISLLSKGLSRVFSSTTFWKHQFFSTQPAFIMVQLSHPYMTTVWMWKTIALTRRTFVDKVISLLLICCLGWS